MKKTTAAALAAQQGYDETHIDLSGAMQPTVHIRLDQDDNTIRLEAECWMDKAGIKSLRRVLKAMEDRLP